MSQFASPPRRSSRASAFARRHRTMSFAAGLLALAVVTTACDAGATSTTADASAGIAPPESLAPFESSDEAGEKPDLPRVIGYAQLSSNEYDTDVLAGLEAGAIDADLEVRAAQSDGDPQRQIQNTDQFVTSGVGAIYSVALDPAAQAPGLIAAIEEGIAVQTVVFGPSTSVANAPQYEMGKALAESAVDYIESELGGEAKVALLNLDSVEALRPRYEAMRDVLGDLPGVEIVADIEPASRDTEAAFATMSSILQQTPDVNVVLSEDFFSLGALSAMEAARVDLSNVFIGGVNASEEARSAVASGGPYRAVVTTSPVIMAYAMARQAGDWLDGRAIPQGICIVPRALSSPEEIEAYSRDMEDLGAVYADPERLSQYVTFQGTISYETRDQWFNKTWAPTSCGAGE